MHVPHEYDLDSIFLEWACSLLCFKDGFDLQQDQFDRLLPTFIQIIELTEQEESRYWDVVSAVFEGKQVDSVISKSSCYEKPGGDTIGSNSIEAGINKKVGLISFDSFCTTVPFPMSMECC